MDSLGSKRPVTSAEEPYRPKRARYAPRACNTCKRRKLKCSGRVPCERCVQRDEECAYEKPLGAADDQEDDADTRFRNVHQQLANLQNEVETLKSHFSDAQGTSSGGEPIPQTTVNKTTQPEPSPAYIGPTSTEFGLQDVLSLPYGEDVAVDSEKHSSNCANLDLNGMMRLIDTYDEAVNSLYPFVDVKGLREFARDAYERPGFKHAMGLDHSTGSSIDWTTSRDVQVLKLVLATGAVACEGEGLEELGMRLADSVEDAMGTRLKVFQIDLKEIMVFTILSLFYFHIDNDVLAWRYLGFTARGCLEIGLHRRSTWEKSNEQFPGNVNRSWALKMFWCIYVLDRRWAFAAGLPLAFRDMDLDADLPLPDPLPPFLGSMIGYARISGRILDIIGQQAGRGEHIAPEHRALLDLEAQEWRRSVPYELRMPDEIQGSSPNQEAGAQSELRLLLSLSERHLRIHIYRDVLFTRKSIELHHDEAYKAVCVAIDVVKILGELSNASNVYIKRLRFYNAFILAALATLTLAMYHAPDTFAQHCQRDFYLAVDLLRLAKGSSSMSARTRRLVQAMARLTATLTSSAGSEVCPPQMPMQEYAHAQEGPQSDQTWNTQITSPPPDQFGFSQFPTPAAAADNPLQDLFPDLSSLFETVGGAVLSGQNSLGQNFARPQEGEDLDYNTPSGRASGHVPATLPDGEGVSPRAATENATDWSTFRDGLMWQDDEAFTQFIAELL